MDITGVVKFVGQTQQVTEKFKKRDLVITYADNPDYPEVIKFEASGDKCDKLDELKEGDNVTVHFNLRGREWVNKSNETQYFNTLSLWKFDVNQTVAGEPIQTPISIANETDDSGDLPF